MSKPHDGRFYTCVVGIGTAVIAGAYLLSKMSRVVLESFKKILQYEQVETTTPRDALSKAYQYKLIDSEDIWLSMLNDRNNTSHAYNEEKAKQIFQHIQSYLPIFVATYKTLKDKYDI